MLLGGAPVRVGPHARSKPRTAVLVAAALILVLVGGVGGVVPATAAPGTGASSIGHAGRFLTDAQGRVVIVHGLNMVAKLAPYEPAADGFDADDAQFLAAHGFTAVRVGVLLEGLEPQPGQYQAAYLSSIKQTVDLLGSYGIHSLLDFHQDMYNEQFQGEGLPSWMVQDDGLPAQPQAGFPGNYFVMPALNRAFDHFWGNSPAAGGTGLQQWYAAAWAHVAAAFAHDPAVLGYDILNEPWPGSLWPSCFPPAGCPTFDQTMLAPFISRVTAAIRTVDTTHLTFYEPALPFDYGAPTYVGAPAGSNSGFSFHTYCLSALGAPETPPTRAACDVDEGHTFANAEAQAQTSGSALLLSEFGATSDTTELEHVSSQADSLSVPWLEWAYCACGDPTGSGQAESLVYNPAQPPVGANVNATTLAALDEPYPEAVAGTPDGYHFDPTTDVFTFTYGTHSATGGKVTGPTEVYLPGLQYPHGYTADVQGAKVVSAPGASLLQLQNDPGASSVSVTVRP